MEKFAILCILVKTWRTFLYYIRRMVCPAKIRYVDATYWNWSLQKYWRWTRTWQKLADEEEVCNVFETSKHVDLPKVEPRLADVVKLHNCESLEFSILLLAIQLSPTDLVERRRKIVKLRLKQFSANITCSTLLKCAPTIDQ